MICNADILTFEPQWWVHVDGFRLRCTLPVCANHFIVIIPWHISIHVIMRIHQADTVVDCARKQREQPLLSRLVAKVINGSIISNRVLAVALLCLHAIGFKNLHSKRLQHLINFGSMTHSCLNPVATALWSLQYESAWLHSLLGCDMLVFRAPYFQPCNICLANRLVPT